MSLHATGCSSPPPIRATKLGALRLPGPSRPKVVTKTKIPKGMFQSPMNVECDSRFPLNPDVHSRQRNVRFTSTRDIAPCLKCVNSGHYPTAWRMRQIIGTFETRNSSVSRPPSRLRRRRLPLTNLVDREGFADSAQRHMPGVRLVAALADETRHLGVLDDRLRHQNGGRIG